MLYAHACCFTLLSASTQQQPNNRFITISSSRSKTILRSAEPVQSSEKGRIECPCTPANGLTCRSLQTNVDRIERICVYTSMRNLYSCVLHLSYRYFFSRSVERYVIEGERQSLLLVFCPSFNDVIVLRENDKLFCWCFVHHST